MVGIEGSKGLTEKKVAPVHAAPLQSGEMDVAIPKEKSTKKGVAFQETPAESFATNDGKSAGMTTGESKSSFLGGASSGTGTGNSINNNSGSNSSVKTAENTRANRGPQPTNRNLGTAANKENVVASFGSEGAASSQHAPFASMVLATSATFVTCWWHAKARFLERKRPRRPEGRMRRLIGSRRSSFASTGIFSMPP